MMPRRNLFATICGCVLCAVPLLHAKALHAQTMDAGQTPSAMEPSRPAVEHSLRGTPAAEISGLSKAIDLALPDSAAVQAAFDHARTISEPWLLNHVVRCWLFGAKLAETRKLRPDPEVLAASALLHDIGLTPQYTGEVRFEVFGANAARTFVAEHGFDGTGQRLVWDSIALHTTPSIARYKETEVACCAAGVGLDIGGIGFKELGQPAIDKIVGLAPRLAMKQRFEAAMVHIAQNYPATTYDNFIRDYGSSFVPNYNPPSSVEFLRNGPFAE